MKHLENRFPGGGEMAIISLDFSTERFSMCTQLCDDDSTIQIHGSRFILPSGSDEINKNKTQ
jgi:hypothetical protein